jgi:hypothetical protein
MQMSIFELAIQSHLQFLIDEFGFSITEARYDQEMGNAVVIFAKNKTRIEVVRDRGQALISLGDEELDRWDWVEFAEAIQFFSGKSELGYLFTSTNTPLSDDAQVSHLSTLLRTYCEQLLSGKMSIIQLRDAIRTGRTQQTQGHLEQLRDSGKMEKNDF